MGCSFFTGKIYVLSPLSIHILITNLMGKKIKLKFNIFIMIEKNIKKSRQTISKKKQKQFYLIEKLFNFDVITSLMACCVYAL